MNIWRKVVVAVPCLLMMLSAEAHQGIDHTQKDENGAYLSHDKTAPTRMVKAEIPAQKKNGSSRWGADFFPNLPLVTHQGQTVRFYDDLIKDKIVMINFMYASCEESCSLATAQLSRVQNILGDRVGKDVFMYSITIDPEHDTPQVLQQHVEKFNVKPGWTFLTGRAEDIMYLRYKLGFHFEGIRDDIKDHNGAVLMGNQTSGQWMKRSPMDNPYFLAEQFGSWISSWKLPSQYSSNQYSDAPELQIPTMGENLFRSRCTACHTIGGEVRTVGGEGIEKNRRALGPDLFGITQKRERRWLVDWLKDPAGMLAENDPIATRLYAQYNNVMMPNFHLSQIEVDALIEYMEAESLRLENASVVLGNNDN